MGANPAPGTDFTVSFSDPVNPTIQLLTGDLGWIVSAELLSNGNPANIAAITTPASDNFVVKVAKGSGAGAANVGAITLQPTGSHYSSVATGSRISGNLTGNLTVLRNSGTGGEATLTVGGNVASTSTITVPVLKGMLISGDLAGDINVTTKLDDSVLEVDGNVASTSAIDIADMVGSEARVRLTDDLTDQCSGTLILRNGITDGSQIVSVGGALTANGTIDLNDHDIYGAVVVSTGSGSIINVGVIRTSGQISLNDSVQSGSSPFSGSVTVSSMEDLGIISAEYGSPSVHITVEGDMDGAIFIDRGSLASGGLIQVGGNMAGKITMSTDCTNFPGGLVGDISVSGNMNGTIEMCNDSSGDITIAGSMGGSISIGKKLKSDGRILITGVCNGAITIGEETESLSLIRAVGGLGSSGAIRINDSRGDFDARGNMHFGTTASIVPVPPPSVTFDGSIKILRNAGNTDGGDLIGGITVVGCHATTDPLDICICGTNSGRVTITQTSCSNQVSWSCVSGCS